MKRAPFGTYSSSSHRGQSTKTTSGKKVVRAFSRASESEKSAGRDIVASYVSAVESEAISYA